LESQKQPAHAQRPAFRPAHGQGFWKNLADQQRQRQQRDHCQRQRPARVEDHAQRDGEHGGVGKRVTQRERRQQILRPFEQLRDDFAAQRMAFGQLLRLPFTQGKERRFRQREEETRARKNQDRRYRQLHARRLSANGWTEKSNQAINALIIPRLNGRISV